MKKITLFLATIFSAAFMQAQSQGLDAVVVEQYYSTTSDDSTNAADNESATVLHKGSITYRVYVDLAPSYKFIQMFGNSDALDNVLHPLVFKTTTDFFNDPNNGQIYPTANSVINTRKNLTMIDSWLSVGGGCAGKLGITKTEDPDGSIGNANGVLTATLGGPLGAPINSIVSAQAKDGLMPGNPIAPSALGTGTLTDVFDQTAGSIFSCTNCAISALGGARGTTTTNLVLLGQFTTNGIFSFSLNIQLLDTVTNTAKVFVPSNPDAATNEILFPGLMYTSPTTTTSPPTNTNVETGIAAQNEVSNLSVFPNPTRGQLIIRAAGLKSATGSYKVMDLNGRVLTTREIETVSGILNERVDISSLASGMYILEVTAGEAVSRRKIVKE